jgi:hypothetical protein
VQLDHPPHARAACDRNLDGIALLNIPVRVKLAA